MRSGRVGCDGAWHKSTGTFNCPCTGLHPCLLNIVKDVERQDYFLVFYRFPAVACSLFSLRQFSCIQIQCVRFLCSLFLLLIYLFFLAFASPVFFLWLIHLCTYSTTLFRIFPPHSLVYLLFKYHFPLMAAISVYFLTVSLDFSQAILPVCDFPNGLHPAWLQLCCAFCLFVLRLIGFSSQMSFVSLF